MDCASESRFLWTTSRLVGCSYGCLHEHLSGWNHFESSPVKSFVDEASVNEGEHQDLNWSGSSSERAIHDTLADQRGRMERGGARNTLARRGSSGSDEDSITGVSSYQRRCNADLLLPREVCGLWPIRTRKTADRKKHGLRYMATWLHGFDSSSHLTYYNRSWGTTPAGNGAQA